MTSAVVSALNPDYTAAGKNGAQSLSMDQQGNLRVTSNAAFEFASALTSGVAAPAGRQLMITASVAGTVTLILAGGQTVVVNPVVGDNYYPFAVTKATTGTATVSQYYNLS